MHSKPISTKVNGLLILLMLSASINVLAQIQVIHSSKIQENSTRDGLFYTLPRTSLVIEVTVEKTQLRKGPFSDLAAKYFPFSPFIDSNRSSFRISEILVNPVSEPDPEQVYYIQFPVRLTKESWNVGADIEPRTNALKEINFVDKENIFPKTEKLVIDSVIKIADGKYFSNDFVRIISDGVKTREEIAKEYIGLLRQVRESKTKLLSGFQEIGYSKESVKFMVEELERLENQYLDLFRGKQIVEQEKVTYQYLPESFKEGEEVPLFKFSGTQGILELRNPGVGDVVFIEIVRNGYSLAASKIKMTNPDGTEVMAGLYYRLPEPAAITLYMNGKEISRSMAMINQFGSIRLLPPGRFKAALDPESGALLKLVY